MQEKLFDEDTPFMKLIKKNAPLLYENYRKKRFNELSQKLYDLNYKINNEEDEEKKKEYTIEARRIEERILDYL